eukprot:scaffold29337_cov26-Tisochrysis_lutea.AAC.2
MCALPLGVMPSAKPELVAVGGPVAGGGISFQFLSSNRSSQPSSGFPTSRASTAASACPPCAADATRREAW